MSFSSPNHDEDDEKEGADDDVDDDDDDDDDDEDALSSSVCSTFIADIELHGQHTTNVDECIRWMNVELHTSDRI